MRFLSSAAIVSVAAAAAVALAGTSQAAAPTRATVMLTRQVPVFASCDGFVVKATFELTREITTFTDATGTPVRRQIHATITGVLSNSIDGDSLGSTGVRIFHTDLLTGDTFTTGSNTVVRQSGGGTIVLGTGRLQFDAAGMLVGYSGPTDDGEYADLCKALS